MKVLILFSLVSSSTSGRVGLIVCDSHILLCWGSICVGATSASAVWDLAWVLKSFDPTSSSDIDNLELLLLISCYTAMIPRDLDELFGSLESSVCSRAGGSNKLLWSSEGRGVTLAVELRYDYVFGDRMFCKFIYSFSGGSSKSSYSSWLEKNPSEKLTRLTDLRFFSISLECFYCSLCASGVGSIAM